MNTYETDWSNIDLTSGHERDLNIVDPYSFNTLLLELHCNIPKHKLTKEAIEKHFNEVLEANVSQAREILRDNIDNVLKHAKKN